MDEIERRKRAWEKVKSFGLKFPANWKFDRDQTNMRSEAPDLSVAFPPVTSNPLPRS